MPVITTSPAPKHHPQDTTSLLDLDPIILVDSAASSSSSPHIFSAITTSTTTPFTIRRGYTTHILYTHVWNGLAVFAILVIIRHATIRILSCRRRWRRKEAEPRQQHEVKVDFDWRERIDPRIGPVFHPPGSSLAPGQQQVHYRFAPLGAPPFWRMDDDKNKSRGVTSSSRTSFSAPLAPPLPPPDGDAALVEDSTAAASGPVAAAGRTVSFLDAQLEGEGMRAHGGVGGSGEKMGLGNNKNKFPSDLASFQKRLISRPPPPPPLTPPELSTAVFTFDTRRPFRAASGGGLGLDDSFIHQPNPDYMSSSSSRASATAPPPPPPPPPPTTTTTATSPRRRSYAKAMPIGIPTPQPSSLSGVSVVSSSNADATVMMTDPAAGPAAAADLVFSPSSYPPTSPQLPPAPPGYEDMMEPSSFSRHHSSSSSPSRREEGGRNAEVDVQGEVISMTDGHGAGWKRHTRVYGGGICLACAASGGEGGFYGETVSEEEKR